MWRMSRGLLRPESHVLKRLFILEALGEEASLRGLDQA